MGSLVTALITEYIFQDARGSIILSAIVGNAFTTSSVGRESVSDGVFDGKY